MEIKYKRQLDEQKDLFYASNMKQVKRFFWHTIALKSTLLTNTKARRKKTFNNVKTSNHLKSALSSFLCCYEEKQQQKSSFRKAKLMLEERRRGRSEIKKKGWLCKRL